MEFIKKSFNYIFVAIFGYILLLNGLYDNFSNIVPLLVAALIVFLFTFLFRSKKIININYKKAWIITLIVFAVLLAVVTYFLEVNSVANWDFAKLYTTAYGYVKNPSIVSKDYYARYPNNLFWLSFLILIYKSLEAMFGPIEYQTFVHVCMVLSCICVFLSVVLIQKTAKRLWNEKKAFYVGLISCTFLPFFLYSQYFYTDTPTILLISILLYVYFRIDSQNTAIKLVLAAIIGVLSGLIFKSKIISFIIVFAIIIDSLTKHYKKLLYWGMLVLSIACALITIWTLKGFEKSYINISEEQKTKLEFPSTHWVMMGFNKNSDGGYIQSDVDYTCSFNTKDAKRKANIKIINKRLKNMGLAGSAKHILVVKTYRVWSDGSMAGREYVSRNPLHKESLVYNIMSRKGKYHLISYAYANTFYLLLLLGMIISTISSIKNKNYRLNFLRLSLIGIFIFMLVWECNSRYLLTFIPPMLLLSADGIGDLLHIKKRG